VKPLVKVLRLPNSPPLLGYEHMVPYSWGRPHPRPHSPGKRPPRHRSQDRGERGLRDSSHGRTDYRQAPRCCSVLQRGEFAGRPASIAWSPRETALAVSAACMQAASAPEGLYRRRRSPTPGSFRTAARRSSSAAISSGSPATIRGGSCAWSWPRFK
jgi:hypothetical protein